MNKKYNKSVLHHIYTIIEPDTEVVYVGKTTTRNPHKKRTDILNGKVSTIDGEFTENCIFILLESIYTSKPDAFRHILAWYRFFEDNGFDVLVSKKSAYMLEFPKSKTVDIYNEVCLPYSVKEVLERKVVPLNNVNETKDLKSEQLPFTQLNIRVRENVADSFRAFSKRLGLSQNDTLKILLSEKDDEMKTSLADKICTLKQENDNNKELLKQQRKQNKEDNNRALKKYKELLEIFKNSINLYVNFLEDAPHEEIKPQRIKDEYGKKLFHSYLYPETSGCCMATLEGIIIGNYRTSQIGTVRVTRFLLFKTLNNETLKLRLFEKSNFVGQYPISHAYKNSLWIVGYTLSNDGGCNMVLGIPVNCAHTDSQEYENTISEEKNLSSLNDLIFIAEELGGNIS